MAGHSKWAQIKRKKAVTDIKRSKEFTRLAKAIAVESRLAKGDITHASLRAAIEKARAANMPKENIERAVLKGAGPDATALEHVTYEMYGPGGTAILIDVITDNKNRSVQELRHLVSKNGFALAEPGAAQWAFSKVGMEWQPSVTVDITEPEAEALAELLAIVEEYDDVQGIATNAVGFLPGDTDE